MGILSSIKQIFKKSVKPIVTSLTKDNDVDTDALDYKPIDTTYWPTISWNNYNFSINKTADQEEDLWKEPSAFQNIVSKNLTKGDPLFFGGRVLFDVAKEVTADFRKNFNRASDIVKEQDDTNMADIIDSVVLDPVKKMYNNFSSQLKLNKDGENIDDYMSLIKWPDKWIWSLYVDYLVDWKEVSPAEHYSLVLDAFNAVKLWGWKWGLPNWENPEDLEIFKKYLKARWISKEYINSIDQQVFADSFSDGKEISWVIDKKNIYLDDGSKIPLTIWWKKTNISSFNNFFNSSFDEFLDSGDISVRNLKRILTEQLFPREFIDLMTEEKIEKLIVNRVKSTNILDKNRNELIWWETFDWMANIFKNEYWIITKFTVDEAKTLAKEFDVLNLETTDSETFKKTLLSSWIREDIVAGLDDIKILEFKGKVDWWKTDNWIIDIKEDWWIVRTTWWYIYDFDWEWNLLKSERVEWAGISESDRRMMEYNMFFEDEQTDFGWLLETFAPVAKEKYSNNSSNELTAVVLDALKAYTTEKNEPMAHLKWTLLLIDKARRDWEEWLAVELETKLMWDVEIYNTYVRNLKELTKIKLREWLVWQELSSYIKDNYWMKITYFLKRDSDGKPIDTNWWNISDYIINKQVKNTNHYYKNSKNVSDWQEIYHTIISWLWETTAAWFKKPITWLQWLTWAWTVRAQIQAIWWFDPIPWLQPWELYRRTINQVWWLTDETLALLAPEILKTAMSWWASLVAWWASLLSKAAGASKLTTTASLLSKASNYTTKANKLARWVFVASESIWKADKTKLWLSFLLNAWMRWVRELNIETQFNRIDPERWESLNTNLALWTLLIPRIFDANRLVRNLWINSNWIATFDMLKHAQWKSVSWGDLSKQRKFTSQAMSAWIQHNMEKLWEIFHMASKSEKETLNALFAWSAIMNKATLKEFMIKWVMWSADNYISDVQALAWLIWKWIKATWDEDIMKLTKKIQNILKKEGINPADIFKEVNNIPWEVKMWKLTSSIADNEEAAKNLAAYMTDAIKKWNIVPRPQVNPQMKNLIDTIFDWKFLPEKKFDKWELITAWKKAEWTYLDKMFKPENLSYYFKEIDDWGKELYVLTDKWYDALWIPTSPSKTRLLNQLKEWDYNSLVKTLDWYLDWWWQAFVDDLPIIEKILSDKLC